MCLYILNYKGKSMIDSNQPSFNAVVEGTEQDEWPRFYFKLVSIIVPEGSIKIGDGVYAYELHGRTKDYGMIEPAQGTPNLEAKIDFLGFCPGVVLRDHPTQVLGRPRAVCMRDGRIFIDQDMRREELYVSMLMEALPVVGKLFSDPTYERNYRTLMGVRV